MKRYDYIVAYDIADTKRLVKIAKMLEKYAVRIQYSVFLYRDATKADLNHLSDLLIDLCNENEDDIRIYKIKRHGLHFGSAIDLSKPLIVT